jgi:signal transduction histidine kinase
VEIEVTADPPGWRVLDRGPGTARETRERLFDRFRRGQREGGPGSGIGLAIVKAVAEGHGGSVGVEDRPGGGSAFWIRLPSAPQQEL